MLAPFITFGQRSGKTKKAMEEAYRVLLEDKTKTLGVTNEFIYAEMLRLFPTLEGRIKIIDKYSKPKESSS